MTPEEAVQQLTDTINKIKGIVTISNVYHDLHTKRCPRCGNIQ